MRDAAQRIEKNFKAHEIYASQVSAEHPFRPKISSSAADLSMRSDNSMFVGSNRDFLERQEAFLAKQMEKREKARIEISEESSCTFRP